MDMLTKNSEGMPLIKISKKFDIKAAYLSRQTDKDKTGLWFTVYKNIVHEITRYKVANILYAYIN
jgi:hypothetical protein